MPDPSNQPAAMLNTSIDKEKDQDAAHYEHAYLEDKTIHIASAPEAQDPSGPALAPGEKEDKATRRLIRKIDIRLLPVLAVIYAFALIDRVNLPNARIAGMGADLGLSVGDRYSLVVMIFFVSRTSPVGRVSVSKQATKDVDTGTLCHFSIPSQYRLSPPRALLMAAFTRGVLGNRHTRCWLYNKLDPVDCVSNLARNPGGMLSATFGVLFWLVNATQSGFYPGCIFLLSCWYCRFEVQKRFSGFYLLALLASGFSNILAWALSLMKGVGGLNGWRWIFIMVS